MANSTTRANGIIRARVAAFVIVMVALLGTAYVFMPADLFRSGSPAPRTQQYPPCPGAKDIATTAKETVVEVKAHCLTGRILLPVGHDFAIDAPGELEYFFWNGQRFLVQDKKTRWLGQVPYSTFRLRGKSGQATIFFTKQ